MQSRTLWNFRMSILSKAVLILLVVSGTVTIVPMGDVGFVKSFCDGRRYALSTAGNGASPYIRLTAQGIAGQFLLDYGTTKSSLAASVFARQDASDDLSLPGYRGEKI